MNRIGTRCRFSERANFIPKCSRRRRHCRRRRCRRRRRRRCCCCRSVGVESSLCILTIKLFRNWGKRSRGKIKGDTD